MEEDRVKHSFIPVSGASSIELPVQRGTSRDWNFAPCTFDYVPHKSLVCKDFEDVLAMR